MPSKSRISVDNHSKIYKWQMFSTVLLPSRLIFNREWNSNLRKHILNKIHFNWTTTEWSKQNKRCCLRTVSSGWRNGKLYNRIMILLPLGISRASSAAAVIEQTTNQRVLIFKLRVNKNLVQSTHSTVSLSWNEYDFFQNYEQFHMKSWTNQKNRIRKNIVREELHEFQKDNRNGWNNSTIVWTYVYSQW